MLGFRVQINDLPEQPGEPKIPLHRLLLPVGILLFAIGLYGLHNYFSLKGPPLKELHVLKLTSVTNVVIEPEIPGSTKIDNIWLQTSDGAKIRYRHRHPYSDEIQRLNPDYGLLLDITNFVWGVTKSDGQVLALNYFEQYNIEAKFVGLYCGSFIGIFGLILLAVSMLSEQKYRADKLKPKDLNPIRTRKLILIGSIGGYLIFCFTVIFPLLSGKVPNFVLLFIWVAGAGLIGNGLTAWFRSHPPKQ